eukprot:TRINITY_DN16840_c0_g1_i1.p1 TRINITY_DN16840_c0_g1~~TRINITY_DN16840_c0_g1_i1.p1  ORF type:complete len:104 (+),score=31.21 TRINITY_DN16840_c0_g1_i1:278-589(+)
MPIHVVATVTVQAGEREKFLAILMAMVPAVLAEDGCLMYEPTVEMDPVSEGATPARKDVVVVLEKWESAAHLKAHTTAPHYIDFSGKVKDILVALDVQVLEKV